MEQEKKDLSGAEEAAVPEESAAESIPAEEAAAGAAPSAEGQALGGIAPVEAKTAGEGVPDGTSPENRAFAEHAPAEAAEGTAQTAPEAAPEGDISAEGQAEPPAEVMREAQTEGLEALAAGGAGSRAENAPMQPVEPPKKKRRWILNLLLIAVIGLGIYSMFGISGELNQEGMGFSGMLSRIDVVGAAILVAVVVGSMTLDCLKYVIINKAVLGKARPLIAIKTNFLGKFYDGVTPFSSGGQPMQIYYMTTKKISGAASSAVVLIKYFGSMFAFTILGAAFMIAGTAVGVLDGVGAKTWLIVLGWVGLAIAILPPLFVVAFVIFPRLARRLTGWFIFVGWKLKIVKSKERTMRKALRTVRDFRSCFKIIARRPLLLALFVLCCFVETMLTFTTPYFVMDMLSCKLDGMFFTVVALNVFTVLGVSFIPTPGNSGAIEGIGVLAFSVAAGTALAWSVFFWRFATYYVYILVGLIITIVDLFRKNIVIKKKSKS